MTHIQLISKAIDFIENNLKEQIGIEDVARKAGCSLYHFARLFNRYTHHTPYDYMMRRRLAESAGELLFTDKKIIDIALDYCFNNPETFSRTFKKVFGVQPKQWRKQKNEQAGFLMPRLTRDHLLQLQKGAYLKPVKMEQEALHLVGLMAPVNSNEGKEEVLHDLFMNELKKWDYSLQDARYYGAVCYWQSIHNRGFSYFIGIESDMKDFAPGQFVTKIIQSFPCIRFIHKGAFKNRRLTLDYIYHTWQPKAGENRRPDLELYYFGNSLQNMDDKGREIEIYIPV
ncbi:MAG: AraC family transcriptional regulator [Spirochaetales bacterium]|nr:AraC family transcriptional regulator [Spirochaetales bacterium]